MKELKPCPFCNGKASRVDDEIVCSECFASTSESCTPASDWNKRVKDNRIKELEDELLIMSRAAKELHNAISDYRKRPNANFKSRMLTAAETHKKRIFDNTILDDK